MLLALYSLLIVDVSENANLECFAKRGKLCFPLKATRQREIRQARSPAVRQPKNSYKVRFNNILEDGELQKVDLGRYAGIGVAKTGDQIDVEFRLIQGYESP